MSALPAIPEPVDYDRDRFEVVVPAILQGLDGCDDLDTVTEVLARAAALEEYLARRGQDIGPAQTVARMSEVRIGELLGEPVVGRPPGNVSSARHFRRRQDAVEFRQMAGYRSVVEDNLPASRKEILVAIKRRRMRHIDDNARVIRTVAAVDVTGDGWTLMAGTLADRLADLEPGSVDMIVTDPPYPAESLPLWSDLAEAAAKLLKPQAVVVALSGQILLPEVIGRMAEHLAWGWCYCQTSQVGASSRILARQIGQEWKPWLAFSNGPWPSGRIDWHPDLISSRLTKTRYRWEQDADPAAYLIERLCPENGSVLDPFAGTGSYGVAALTTGRQFVGIEPDGQRFLTAVDRLTYPTTEDRSR
jgi:site-specific DNA-methyltransferase (adenine-specific)